MDFINSVHKGFRTLLTNFVTKCRSLLVLLPERSEGKKLDDVGASENTCSGDTLPLNLGADFETSKPTA